ncbi:hydroxymethylglutaryl-CoA lyase [Panacibacter ginsenosidivorans]|uniref:Hydroxymethylglutaryl-CoA lyase n=1 Tax=Panacibacter ginsenosidivorans TaxID=1813871 RepID=A0A5B8VEP7_9BACT|nr:hydroxymethylglutaryl-CoA lyase [Panacibacter ginsenosidivorans]QEC69523.1 hydroxymethylglutaryl-CoA lyase [Panacibacter ginsenosidivorans]
MQDVKYIKLVECPRDAMQGWLHFIPTQQKVAYINALLNVGFDTIDFGSFVSPKAIPQMADTKEVLNGLQLRSSKTKLLAIVANMRGAEEAVLFDAIDYLGFPFSISPTFQLRNTNSTIEESFSRVEEIQNLCIKNKKQLVIYLSMGFGNPYGDVYNESILTHWAAEIAKLDVKIISLADTVGVATPQQISAALNVLIPLYKDIEFGVHLHSAPLNICNKLQAAVDAGCKRFDGALKGIGGCPMAQDDLVGNMPTELMISFFEQQHLLAGLNNDALQYCLQLANKIFV